MDVDWQILVERFIKICHTKARAGLIDYGWVFGSCCRDKIETVQRQATDILGGQQHCQHAWAGHALFDQLSRFVGGDRCRFAVTATINLADMFDDTDLHRHDIQLFADFFADHMLAATAGTGQFVLGQFLSPICFLLGEYSERRGD